MADPGDLSWWFGGATPQNTQYQDRDQIMALINGGLGNVGPGGQTYGGTTITNMQAPQMQAAQAGPAAQMQAAQLQMGSDPFRAAQLQQLGQLQGVASGQQKGAGELAVERQMGNALAAQQAQARMARGGNAALAYRRAADQSAALGSTAAGLGQQAAMTDQMNAHGLLGQIGASGRAGDFSTANANAGYQQQAGLQNAGFQQQTGLTNAGFQQGANQYNAGLQQQGQQLNSQNYLGLLDRLSNMNANQLAAQQGAAQNKGMIGPLLSAGGQIGAAAMMSDERLKTDVTDEREKIDAMLDGLRPVGWRYKDPKFGEGRHSGVMAQDMERSEAGRQVVSDTPDGKALDVNKALGAALASSARLNERLRKLEDEARADGAADLPRARVVKR